MFKNSDMAAVKLGLDKIYKNLTQELTYESYKIALIGNLVKNSSNQYTWNQKQFIILKTIGEKIYLKTHSTEKKFVKE